MAETSLLPVAVRAYTLRRGEEGHPDTSRQGRRAMRDPDHVLVFDTETTTDASQRLNFGSWRYYRVTWTEDEPEPQLVCVEEGLFYGDDLLDRYPEGYQALRDFAGSRAPDVDRRVPDAAWHLPLISAREFATDVLIRQAFRGRAWIVAFNLSFDLSRLAAGHSVSRDYLPGGFSLVLGQYLTKDGAWAEHRWRSRVAIKTLDSKRSLIGFKRPLELDEVDRIPDEESTPAKGYTPRGHFLDPRTLAFALTNNGYTLEGACKEFRVEHPKPKAERHGIIDPEYIEYNRRDVRATGELFARLQGEYRRHPIRLQATKAYSPASVGKAYLRAMGIRPPLERQGDIDPRQLGRGMVAYYGGRAECRIRRTPVPVVYVDFLSMYPTINSLMGMWDLVTAGHINLEGAHVARQVQDMLDNLTLDDCFDPERWPDFVGLVQLAPEQDVLPVRSRYGGTPSWGIGINPLTCHEPLWFTIADAVAAKLFGGKSPRILNAVRLNPKGRARGLREVTLPGGVTIDPRRQDFFRTVVEERHRLDERDDLSTRERRVDRFLKVLANSASYGIYAEMNRNQLPGHRTERVDIHGLETFTDRINAPESPGEFAFPPMAACITGAARLMLALLERSVTDAGGHYAFCDTDSMAIVATQNGGLIPCPGGRHHLPDATPAIQALSWDQVEAIRRRFLDLSPYDRSVIPGSILELEDENFADKQRTKRRQLYCFSISAKRYALYELGGDGQVLLDASDDAHPGHKWSEHGLGHLLNPTDPDSDDRDWIRQLWLFERQRVYRQDPTPPPWLHRPAIGRITIAKPIAVDAFETLNRGLPYAEQVKPYNFLLTAHTAPFGHPTDTDPLRFQLIAPYEPDPHKWLDLNWTNKYDGQADAHAITTTDDPRPDLARVQSYADTLAAYRVHPEPKSLAPDGNPAGWHGNGLLTRRPVTASRIVHIGKESNELEDIQAGTIHELGEVVNQHVSGDPWRHYVMPVLQSMSRSQLRKAGLSGTSIAQIKAGAFRGTARTRAKLAEVAGEFARRELREARTMPPGDPIDSCAALLRTPAK